MKKKRWTLVRIMIPGFAALIFFGGCLLTLPVSNADGRWLNFVDALFTACTCVCVTGLTTIVPATQFSIFGKAILLILIQIGGIGILVSATYLMILLKKRVSLGTRVLIQNRFSMKTMSGLVKMLIYVVQGTFLVEGIGALCMAVRFVPEYGLLKGICFSVFHSVSAFCNAGVDLLGSTSLQKYQSDPWMLLVVSALVIIGGLGYLVWKDLTDALQKIRKKELGLRKAMEKLQLHTKLTLIMTAGLLLFGMIFFVAAEWNNGKTIGNLSVGDKLLTGFFQSMTVRTAGFYTISQASLRESSKLAACMLMFIGGSPVGTAGGVKTVTVAVLALTCWSIMKGRTETSCFKRRIADETVRTAMLVMSVSLGLTLIGTMILSLLEPGIPLVSALYEVTSAVATVGLTADVTPFLGTPAKLLIILLMYMGRIGPITIPLVIASKLGKKGQPLYPEEHVVVG